MNTNTTVPHPTCPTRLSESQIQEYRTRGYLAFNDVLSAEEVEKARSAISEIITEARKHVGESHLGQSWAWIQMEPGQKAEDFQSLSQDDFELKVRKIGRFHKNHSHMHYLAKENPRIKGVLKSLIGANPILAQDMALIKPPLIGSEKPWHQDTAYFAIAPLDSVVGVWIALDDATIENGCMHAIPGGQKIGPVKHHHTFDCEIVSGRIDPSKAVPVEIPAGGAMFFHGLLPHQTPPNSSPDRRRALQFHYRSADSKIVDKALYDTIFCEKDGTPASCAAAPK